ncbi:MAG: hypothetical protein KDD22_07935, partial [Bdellovibrionales bacterium]|nr:hypothetical protein [Bdellovibrionales bacterium]
GSGSSTYTRKLGSIVDRAGLLGNCAFKILRQSSLSTVRRWRRIMGCGTRILKAQFPNNPARSTMLPSFRV